MEINEVFRDENVNFTGIESTYFLIGLLSEFGNRFQAMADKQMGEVSWKQFFALVCINVCNEPPSISELAKIMGSSHQNVKQILLKLEKKGFVTIMADEQDKRRQRVKLAEHCAEFCASNEATSTQAIQSIFAGVSEEQLQSTIRTILKMVDNIKRMQ